MFAQALKFKRKYYIQPEIAATNNNDIYSEVELIEAKKNLLRIKSFLEAKNDLLKAELSELEALVDKFLHEYFENTLTKFHELNFSQVMLVPNFDIGLIHPEVKKINFDAQLKNVFKKIAKIAHPDVCSTSSENYIKAQEFYDNGDIENLYFLYNQLSGSDKPDNLVTEIEQLECQIGFISRSNKSLASELEDLYDSKEYILFLKCRSYQARGVDFYKEILKFN